jgi:hypothetical protein
MYALAPVAIVLLEHAHLVRLGDALLHNLDLQGGVMYAVLPYSAVQCSVM